MGSSGIARSRILDEVHANAGSASSTSEQTLASLVLPAGIVAVGDVLKFSAFGDAMNNSGSTVTYTWRFKIGSTTLLATPALSHATGANRRKWTFNADIMFPTTASERVGGRLLTTGSSNQTMDAVATALVADGYGEATEDTAAALNVILTCQLGTSAATADVILRAAALELVKKA